MITKIAKLGAAVVEVCLADDATVGDALEAGSIILAEKEMVKVNGNNATDATALNDGDLITIVPNIKGGAGEQKLVKLARLGAPVVEYFIENGHTVADILRMANLTLGADETVKVNGGDAQRSQVVENGDLLTVVPKIKGGSGERKFVKLARLGTPVVEYFIENGHTVADILRMAGLSLGADETVKVNGSDAPRGQVVQDGDLLTVVPKIKGGRR
jgi:sulfur carrier protein ThiS